MDMSDQQGLYAEFNVCMVGRLRQWHPQSGSKTC